MGAGSAKVGHPCTGILCLSCPPLSFCDPQQAPLCPHQLLGPTLFHFPSLGTLCTWDTLTSQRAETKPPFSGSGREGNPWAQPGQPEQPRSCRRLQTRLSPSLHRRPGCWAETLCLTEWPRDQKWGLNTPALPELPTLREPPEPSPHQEALCAWYSRPARPLAKHGRPQPLRELWGNAMCNQHREQSRDTWQPLFPGCRTEAQGLSGCTLRGLASPPRT